MRKLKLPKLIEIQKPEVDLTKLEKSVILNADDYGGCNFIDNGIIEAIRNKKINSVSTFVTFPDSVKRIEYLLKIREKEKLDFKIGLHFSITTGFSLIPDVFSALTVSQNKVKFDCDKKNHYRFIPVNRYTFSDKRGVIEVELQFQLRKLATILGGFSKIDHVDCHHGLTYINNKLFSNYVRISNKLGNIPIRSPRAWSTPGKFKLKRKSFGKFPSPFVQNALDLELGIHSIEAAQITVRENYAKDKIVFPDIICNLIYGIPLPENLDFLIDEIYNCPQNLSVEFMFHLGRKNNSNAKIQDKINPDDFFDIDYMAFREKELSLLLNYDYQKFYEKNIKIINFRDLKSKN